MARILSVFTRWPASTLAVWTLVVWVGRVRNVAADDDLSTGGRAWRMGAAVVFVVLALVVLFARLRRSPWSGRALAVLVGWTLVWWTVRGIGILLDPDHDVGFKVVHTVLMIGSIGLAMWAWRRRGG